MLKTLLVAAQTQDFTSFPLRRKKINRIQSWKHCCLFQEHFCFKWVDTDKKLELVCKCRRVCVITWPKQKNQKLMFLHKVRADACYLVGGTGALQFQQVLGSTLTKCIVLPPSRILFYSPCSCFFLFLNTTVFFYFRRSTNAPDWSIN